MINLLQMLIYFKQMDLPWNDFLNCMPVNSNEKTFRMVMQKKEQCNLTQLAKLYGMGPEFTEAAGLVDQLGYEDYPNYTRIRKLLRQVVDRENPLSRMF